LVFLIEAHLKPVLGNFYEIGYYKIIELVRLSAVEGVGNVSFSSL